MKINAVIHKSMEGGLVNGNFTEYRFFLKKNLYSVKFPFTKPLHGSKKTDFAKILNLYNSVYLGSTT
jgi:hypothetical protein